MRLIDADALCRHLSDWQFGSMTDGKHDAEYEVINKVIAGIDKEQTVSPDMAQVLAYECGKESVQVVRCKDCKHWDDVPADETQDHECHLFDGNEEKIRIATPSYWFCPMGERRTDDVQKTD